MAGEPNIGSPQGDQPRFHLGDRVLAELAGRQHGVVALWQLNQRGLDKHFVSHRLRSGHLHQIHRGVYAVGHRKLSRQGWRMAAVLGGGAAAVLSHRPAGDEWQLRDWSGRQSITVASWRRSTRDIEIHSCSLPTDEVTVLDGIPITTVPRTLLDLATVLDPHSLLSAVNVAEARGLGDILSLPEILERHSGERGTAALRATLESAGYGKGATREALEDLFALFVAERSFPRPLLNAHVQVGDVFYSPDCLWPKQRLIVELHSAKWHGTKPAISRDATRDRRLLLAGYRVIHVTWAQLNNPREADELDRDLRLALSA